MQTLILLSYHFLFFWKFYKNPYLLSTSELASTFFPHWLWMGRKWKTQDNIYYKYPASIPFLSMWYLPNVLISKLSKYLNIDISFKVLSYFILLHSLLGSFLAYKAMGLFGAITLTYAGYCIKPQQPCIAYTLAWMPGMFIEGPLGWISCWMAITGGYWPILVYFFPIAVLINPSCLWGVVPALPQVFLFLWYWKRSIRKGQKIEPKFGRLPVFKFVDLFIPTNKLGPTNGVHYPEVEMYMGIAILFIWNFSWLWIPLIISLLLIFGIIQPIQRIPCRALYLLSLSIALLASFHPLLNSQSISLTILQAFLLLRNSSIYPQFPFSQWGCRPSQLYQKNPFNGTWPNITGYLKGERISDYRGSFRLAE